MCYVKLVLRGVKRSAKDYLIYLVTLSLCAAMFYAFLSVSSKYYKPDIGAEYDMGMVSYAMKPAICAVSLLLFFLIRYVNRFMLLRRQKEFGLQAVMGMEPRAIAGLFFLETFLMGMLALVCGILLGVLCSQFITAMLMNLYGKSYTLTMTFFPDTVLFTLAFFAASFLVVGLFQVRTILKIPAIDMLYGERKNEGSFKKSHWNQVVVLLYLFAVGFMTCRGGTKLYAYYDSSLPLPMKILYLGNTIVPAGILLGSLFWAIRCRGKRFGCLLGFLLAGSLAAMGFAMLVPALFTRYDLPLSGTDREYLFFLLLDLAFAVSVLFYFLGELLTGIKERSVKIRYRGENLFFFGQILSRLKTTYKTMALTCLTLLLSIGLFLAVPFLTGWSTGYYESRIPNAVQIFSRYNGVQTPEELAGELEKIDYSFLEEELSRQGITHMEGCTLSSYFLTDEDFYRRARQDFPILAISLSDYNRIAEILGFEKASLKEQEFLLQVSESMYEEDLETVLEEIGEDHQISTKAGTLTLAEHGIRKERLGEYVYNFDVSVLYVVPDWAAEELLPAAKQYILETEEPIPYDIAKSTEKTFEEKYAETEGGLNLGIRFRSIEGTETLSTNFVMIAAMTYGAVVLFIICFTILSLQQLSEAVQYRCRFSLLHKMGVEKSHINRLILKQLGIWFGLPVLVSALAAVFFLCYLFLAFSLQIRAYIGFGTLLLQAGLVLAVFAVLLLCYFVTTWLFYKRTAGL